MEKRFKIEMPELNINKDQRIREVTFALNEDFEKGGLLNQCLVFIYNSEVLSSSELSEKLSKYYHKEIDKSTIYRNLKRLEMMELVYSRTSGFLMTTEYNELNTMERYMLAKFKKFLDKIPVAFKNRYSDVKFFAIANGFGLEFIKPACKLLNFKCEEEKDE